MDKPRYAFRHVSKKYGNTISEIRKDGFKISKKIDMIPKGNTNYDMAKGLGIGIIEFFDLRLKLTYSFT